MQTVKRVGLATSLLLASAAADAGIVFTPHVAEYSRLAPGQYTEVLMALTEIEKIYDGNGKVIRVGEPFVPAGASTDAALLLYKSLWIGNVFRDTGIPILSTHPQFCRAIGTLWYQQNTEQVAARTRIFGAKTGANGFGDVFGLCGLYGDEHTWGPLKFNGLLATTVKFPVGRYDTDAVINAGTNYWTYIPQLAFHAELFGRIYLDGTFAYQFNGNNDSPSFLGLTPTRPADWRNFEINSAWKFSEHWFAELGFSHAKSVGPNFYDKLDVRNEEPIRAEDLCNGRNTSVPLPPAQCDASNKFFVQSVPGTYQDNGVKRVAVTAGFVYVYRTSSVFNLRAYIPVAGRGGQFKVPLNVYTAQSDNNGGYTRGSRIPGQNNGPLTDSTLLAVQEAGAMSASPFLELRYVYLFWAP